MQDLPYLKRLEDAAFCLDGTVHPPFTVPTQLKKREEIFTSCLGSGNFVSRIHYTRSDLIFNIMDDRFFGAVSATNLSTLKT